MKTKTKRSVTVLGYTFGYGFMLLSLLTFICAYINPSKRIIVDINSFGEQYLDMGCFIFAIIIMTYGLYFINKKSIKQKKPSMDNKYNKVLSFLLLLDVCIIGIGMLFIIN